MLQNYPNQTRMDNSVKLRLDDVKEDYQLIEKIGCGTYGTVFKAQNKKTKEYVAFKKIQNKDPKLVVDGFPITAFREIDLLKKLKHPNIVKLKEIIVTKPSRRNLFRGSTFLVFEYVEHDFAGLFRSRVPFTISHIKCFMKQLLEGVAFLHQQKFLHRDLKSANILLTAQGVVKIADFGLGRKARLDGRYTSKVVTLWYRAPEILLGAREYSNKVDMWSLGCIFVQFFINDIFFKFKEHEQLDKVLDVVGGVEENRLFDARMPEDKRVQHFANYKKQTGQRPVKIVETLKKYGCIDDSTINFLAEFFHLNPQKRISAADALNHPYFTQAPLPSDLKDLPRFSSDHHEMESRKVNTYKNQNQFKYEIPKAFSGERAPYRDPSRRNDNWDFKSKEHRDRDRDRERDRDRDLQKDFEPNGQNKVPYSKEKDSNQIYSRESRNNRDQSRDYPPKDYSSYKQSYKEVSTNKQQNKDYNRERDRNRSYSKDRSSDKYKNYHDDKRKDYQKNRDGRDRERIEQNRYEHKNRYQNNRDDSYEREYKRGRQHQRDRSKDRIRDNQKGRQRQGQKSRQNNREKPRDKSFDQDFDRKQKERSREKQREKAQQKNNLASKNDRQVEIKKQKQMQKQKQLDLQKEKERQRQRQRQRQKQIEKQKEKQKQKQRQRQKTKNLERFREVKLANKREEVSQQKLQTTLDCTISRNNQTSQMSNSKANRSQSPNFKEKSPKNTKNYEEGNNRNDKDKSDTRSIGQIRESRDSSPNDRGKYSSKPRYTKKSNYYERRPSNKYQSSKRSQSYQKKFLPPARDQRDNAHNSKYQRQRNYDRNYHKDQDRYRHSRSRSKEKFGNRNYHQYDSRRNNNKLSRSRSVQRSRSKERSRYHEKDRYHYERERKYNNYNQHYHQRDTNYR